MRPWVLSPISGENIVLNQHKFPPSACHTHEITGPGTKTAPACAGVELLVFGQAND